MDALHTYTILSQRKMNEDSLVWHRMSGLLITNSLLLVAFFMSLPYSEFSMLHIGLPIIAILISLGFGYLFMVGARALIRWNEKLRKIELAPDSTLIMKGFSQMIDIEDEATWHRKCPKIMNLARFYGSYFSLFFIAVWTFCLIGKLN